MLFETILLPGVLVPAAAAGVALLLVLVADRRQRESTVGGGSLAVGGAFIAAYVALTGLPRWPPVESTQRLFFLVLLSAIVGLAWGWRQEKSPPWVVRAALLGLLLSLVLRSLIERWSPGTAAVRLVGLFILGIALLWAFERSLAVGRSTGLVPAAVRLAVFGGSAVVVGLSGTARLGQLMGALTCGVFVVELVARWRRRRPWLAGDGVVLSLAVFGLLLGGFFYASLENWPAIVLGVALLTLGAVAGASGSARWLPLAPLLLALGLVAYAVANQEDDPYGYYGSTPMRGSVSSGAYSAHSK